MSPQIADDVFVAESALVLGDVHIGAGSSVWYGCVVRGDVFHIRIGARTNIQDRTVIHVTTDTHATLIGDGVTVGHGAILHGCRIADGVLVGMAATVLDDVEVGSGSVIAAGALLPPGKKYPERSLIVGAPARVARPVKEAELAWIAQSADRYVQLAERHRKAWR
ncbi:MAG: gamma carbonic anhydrase family protein [Myxococcales bacterium]|nr:gamma carbonic anhydrase family protein [Myxococcales bacterium]